MIKIVDLPVKYPASAPMEFLYSWPIAAALEQSDDFRSFVLNKTKFCDDSHDAQLLKQEQLKKRSKNTSFWSRHPYCERTSCPYASCGETDLLAVFELSSQKRFAIHFEIKQPTDKGHETQPERYSGRMQCWSDFNTRPQSILPHGDAASIVVCGTSFAEKAPEWVGIFDTLITTEELATHLDPYPLPTVSNVQ